MNTQTVSRHVELIDGPYCSEFGVLGTYLVKGENIMLIDPGPTVSIPYIIQELEKKALFSDLRFVALTHIHLDHGGGIGTAHKSMKQAKVVAHPRARPHLIDPSRLWQSSKDGLGDLALKWGDIEPVPEESIMDAEDGMKLDLGNGLVLEIYLTPGHAPHHLSVFDRKEGVLIAGEAAGVCVNGNLRLTTPPPFRLDVMLSSVDKLIALEPERICYGHFGCYDNAMDRLHCIRQKVLDWFEFVKSVKEKSSQEIFKILEEKDRDLDYLKKLTQAQYEREHALLSNTVRGLHEAARKLAE